MLNFMGSPYFGYLYSMRKKIVIIVGSILGVILLVIIGSFIANPIIERKIKETVAKEIPEGFEVNAYEISVNSLKGSAYIKNLQAIANDTTLVPKDSHISLAKASFENLNYRKYFFSDKIAFNSMTLTDLHVVSYRDSTASNTKEEERKEFKEKISSGKFTLENASFLLKNGDESTFLEVDSLYFSVKDVVVNNTTLQEKIPFYFSEMELETRDFFYQLNEQDELSLKEFSVKDKQLQIKNIAIQTRTDTLQIPDIANKRDIKNIQIPSLTISDLHFKVVEDTFQLFGEDFEIENPSLNIQKASKEVAQKTGKPKKDTKETKEFPLPFSLTSLTIKNSAITLLNPDESVHLKVDDFNFSLKDLVLNTATFQQKIPFRFSDVEIKSNAIQYELNAYDLLSLNTFSIQDKELQIENLAIQTVYSKTELSRVISKERDHMDVNIPIFLLKDFYFNTLDTSFEVSGSNLRLDNPALKVYRDKLVTDDTSIKPLYSKVIREIPFPLTIDSLYITNGSIDYEEKVKADQPAGKIFFTNLNAYIGNFSNTYAKGEKKTTIDIRTTFMGESTLSINWNFDINEPDDKFQIQGQLERMNAAKINPFTKSNLRVDMSGQIIKTFFNIHGNRNTSQMDFKINYKDLKVEVLDKNDRKNWLFSAVANIFVKKSSSSSEGTFKEANTTVERNKDKSFFNYLWINIMEGLKQVVVAI